MMRTATEGETMTGTTEGPFRTLADIKAANRKSSQPFWFTPASMRFFRTRIADGVIGGRYFVTSEQFVGSDGTVDPRAYTVRIAGDDGTIDTVGDFQSHATLAQARTAARKLV